MERSNVGRHSEYNTEMADRICERIANGESLRKICDDEDMPNKSTVFRWLASSDEFSDQYARARETQADSLFDEVLAIADQYDSAADTLNPDHINRARLRIDARKWMAGKLRPKVYGDKLDLDLGGTVNFVVSGEPVSEKDWLEQHGEGN